MKRLRSLLLLCLAAVFLLASCRREQSRAPEPESTATATPAAARGGESGADEGTAVPRGSVTAGERAVETVVYAVPFEVRPDGFSFRNYGVGHPEGNFTIDDLRAQFGDGVCSRIEAAGDKCIPTAEAQQWIDDRNADMSYGHCIGFTVTSYRFAEGELQPEAFAPAAASPYDIPRQPPIMRTIALNGSLYWVKSVWSAEVIGTPREIIDALIALGEPVDLSIYLPGLVGGHSLLAYGVEQIGPEKYHILVYDNNYPGEETFVEVDYAADTWRYDQGAVNPGVTAIVYEGDATTETLRFIPLSAYDSVACPFCPPDEDGDEPAEVITLLSVLGQGEILVKTALGTIGSIAGEFVNDIPGAEFIFPRGQLAAYGAPDVALPGGAAFTAQFRDLRRVSSLGPSLSVVIDKLAPGDEDNELVVAADAQTVDFQAGGEQSPSLNVTVAQEEGSYSVSLLGVNFADGQGLSFGAAEGGQGLALQSREVEVEDATLLVTRLTQEGEAVFASSGLNIRQGGGVALDLAAWDGSGSINLYVDEDGDGTYEEVPLELPNEPLDELIRQIDPGLVTDVVDELIPYLGDESLETTLATLPEQGLSGREIGLILLPLQLTDEQLINLIASYELPINELGDLLFALKLEPERLDTIIEGLELSAEDEAALRAYLDELALYHEIAAEWVFLNTDDLSRLYGLLDGYDLTIEQLAELLPYLGLSAEDIQWFLGGLGLSMDDLAAIAELLGIDVPATHTPTPTPTISGTVTITATGTPTITITPTPTSGTLGPGAGPITGTATLTPTGTVVATPSGTPTPESYPGDPPTPTGTPAPYPYPVSSPSPTPTPELYPGEPTATREYESAAFCEGDNLRIIAREPTWTTDVTIDIWLDEELLFTGVIGPDNEPVQLLVSGPDTWKNLFIEASVEPTWVPLGDVTCPP